MVYRYLSELKPHPKNEYYFDDITDEKWYDLLESIRLNGIYTPVVIASPIEKNSDNKMIIVSGHQRVRACKELGIEKIQCVIENFKSEDAMLLALIETNLFQRGSGNTNPIKLGRCLNELDRIYGVKRGNNQHRNPNNLDSMVERKSKKEIAGRLGLSQETLTNYQKLTTLDEELKQMVLDGGISVTNAVKVAKKIQKEKQKDIVGFIREKGKIPGVKIDEIIKKTESGKKPKSEKVEQEKETEKLEFSFQDLDTYVKYGAGYDSDEDDNVLVALETLQKELSKISTYSELMHEYVDHICFSMEDLKRILQNSNSICEIEGEIIDNNLGFSVGELAVLYDDTRVMSQCVRVILDTIENMEKLKNDKTPYNCDSDGYIYNGAGKQIGKIMDYQNRKIVYDNYIKDDKGNFLLYDANNNIIDDVTWF